MRGVGVASQLTSSCGTSPQYLTEMLLDSFEMRASHCAQLLAVFDGP